MLVGERGNGAGAGAGAGVGGGAACDDGPYAETLEKRGMSK